jgi:hypothetical protein
MSSDHIKLLVTVSAKSFCQRNPTKKLGRFDTDFFFIANHHVIISLQILILWREFK